MKAFVALTALPSSMLGVALDFGVESVTLFGIAAALIRVAASLSDLKERVVRIETILDGKK